VSFAYCCALSPGYCKKIVFQKPVSTYCKISQKIQTRLINRCDPIKGNRLRFSNSMGKNRCASQDLFIDAGMCVTTWRHQLTIPPISVANKQMYFFFSKQNYSNWRKHQINNILFIYQFELIWFKKNEYFYGQEWFPFFIFYTINKGHNIFSPIKTCRPVSENWGIFFVPLLKWPKLLFFEFRVSSMKLIRRHVTILLLFLEYWKWWIVIWTSCVKNQFLIFITRQIRSQVVLDIFPGTRQ